MKVRSKKLWQYLSDRGLLNASQEEIKTAKILYRRLYKREWRKNRNLPVKEIRPEFTLREYREIKLRAHEANLNPTKFLKVVALQSIGLQTVPEISTLKAILQILTQAVTSSDGISKSKLNEAERLLLEYVRKWQ